MIVFAVLSQANTLEMGCLIIQPEALFVVSVAVQVWRPSGALLKFGGAAVAW